ncbi:MAG: type II toxin-antitoxin system RelE/ParE family toxin [Planktomarina sp.]
MAWTVETLDHRVDRELRKLPSDILARFIRVSELISELGPDKVGMPHVKYLKAGLWEMRLKGKDGIARAIYVKAQGQRIVVVHAFAKKTQRTPTAALETALQRAKEVI